MKINNAISSRKTLSGILIMFLALPLMSFAAETKPLILKITSDWGSGYNGNITVTNTSDKTIDSWKAAFDFDHKINSIWNANLVSHEGNHYEIENASWNGKLNPGQSTSFGFGGSPGNVTSNLQNIKLNNVSFDSDKAEEITDDTSETDNTEPENTDNKTSAESFNYEKTGDWGSGFNGKITLKNTSKQTSDGWLIEFDYPYEITSIWNAKIKSHAGSHYIIENLSWNKNLTKGQQVSFGFGGKPGNANNVPTNVKLNFNNTTAEEVSEDTENSSDVNQSENLKQNEMTDSDDENESVQPIAENDSFSVFKNTAQEINVLSNDTGDSITLSSITKPSHGTAVIVDNKVKYTPDTDFTGTDEFSYTIKDVLGLTATGLISVNVRNQVAVNKVNATYWCAWGGNTSYNIGGKQLQSQPVEMDKIDLSYNVIITAFIITDSDGNYQLALKDPGSTASSYFSKAQVKEFINKTKAQGRKVIVSLGGAAFHITMKTNKDVTHFVNQMKNIINEYDFDGIDLDLEGGATTSANPELLGEAVLDVVNYYRNNENDFWLTSAPEWCYIIPYTYGTGQWSSHNLQNDFYVKLFNKIGMDNFTYIWPQSYNQGTANGVTGAEGSKVTPVNGMDKFLAALAWGISTTEGYKANGNLGVFIPGDKLCLGIPATEGAAGGEMLYVATPTLLSSAWKPVKPLQKY